MLWSEFISLHALQLLAMPLLLVCAAFFNAAETAMFGLTRAQLYHLKNSGPLGRLVNSLMARPRRVLNIVLLGNMLVTTAYAANWAVLALDMAHGGASAVTIALLTLLSVLVLILVAEITPKTLALLAGQKLAPLLATPLAGVGKVFAPLLWVMERVFVWPLTRILAPQAEPHRFTADELAAMLDLSARRGVIDLEVNALLQEVVSLKDIRARDIMVPRVDLIACEVGSTPEHISDLFRKSHLRRIPVYEGDLDHLLGVLPAKRFLLSPGKSPRELLAKVPFVPEAANIERVLLQFRVTRTQLAIVVDEYGGTAGLVTLEDVLEEIVGDIPDPHVATGPMVERVGQHQYLVDGELPIHQWSDVFQTDLARGRISTVGGFVTSMLGRLPKAGDTVVYRNLKFTVESMRRRRIEKLRLELLEEAT